MFSLSPKRRYAPEEAEAEEFAKPLSPNAGRQAVRSINIYPILSEEWVGVVDKLKELAHLVVQEESQPSNPKVDEIQGRNSDSGGTLWDQVATENVIRILVEEAKVNLCIRMIKRYKEWWYEGTGGNRQPEIEEAAERLGSMLLNGIEPGQVRQACAQFELSIGLLLEGALKHVEVLQLIDLPMTMEHCAFVLEKSLNIWRPVELHNGQEFVVVKYIASLMQHSEKLSHTCLLPKMRELRVLPLFAQHALEHGEQYDQGMVSSICEGLSALADNEDFITEWESHLVSESHAPDPEVQRVFLMLEEQLVGGLLARTPDKRREMRPLLELFNKIRRVLT